MNAINPAKAAMFGPLEIAAPVNTAGAVVVAVGEVGAGASGWPSDFSVTADAVTTGALDAIGEAVVAGASG